MNEKDKRITITPINNTTSNHRAPKRTLGAFQSGRCITARNSTLRRSTHTKVHPGNVPEP
jgi:hypothetical protein